MDKQVPADQNSQAAFAPMVDGDTRAMLLLACKQRGDYRIDRVLASSDFPFGLHTAVRTIDCSPGRLLVYPRTFLIHQLPGFDSRSHCFHGERIINQPDIDEEYAGIRAYRHGDSLKHIHWAASAKHQELIVREFESYSQPAMLIILNCNIDDELGSAPDSSFEYSIEVAASLMLFASRQGFAVELMAEGERACHISLAPGEKVTDFHLGQFARMNADGCHDYWQQVNSVCHRFRHIDTVVTFSTQQTIAPQLLDDRNHIDIRFDHHSFVNRTINASPPGILQSGKRVTYCVPWGQPLESLFHANR